MHKITRDIRNETVVLSIRTRSLLRFSKNSPSDIIPKKVDVLEQKIFFCHAYIDLVGGVPMNPINISEGHTVDDTIEGIFSDVTILYG